MTSHPGAEIIRAVLQQVLPEMPSSAYDVEAAMKTGNYVTARTSTGSFYVIHFDGDIITAYRDTYQRGIVYYHVRKAVISKSRGDTVDGFVGYDPVTQTLLILDDEWHVRFRTSCVVRADEIVQYT